MTLGFAGSSVKFAFLLAQGTCEDMLMPSQLAGLRDQQEVWCPPWLWCLRQATPLVPPAIGYIHTHMHMSPVLPAQSLWCWQLQGWRPCAGTELWRAWGYSGASMYWLGKSELSITVAEKSLRNLVQDLTLFCSSFLKMFSQKHILFRFLRMQWMLWKLHRHLSTAQAT